MGKAEANAIACLLVQLLQISNLTGVSAEVGLQPPAHISAVQTSFFFIRTVSRYCQPGALLLSRESVSSPIPGLGRNLTCTGMKQQA